MVKKTPKMFVLKDVTLAFRLGLWGYLATGAWVLVWQLWLSPHQHLDALPITVAWLIPWLFPMLGMLKRKPYTYAWSCFIALLYLTHALVIITIDTQERWLAAVELLTVTSWLLGAVTFIRSRAVENMAKDSKSA